MLLSFIDHHGSPVSSIVTCLGVQFDSQLAFYVGSVPRSPLFLPSSAAAVAEAVADNRISKSSGARTDC